jgi:hypothetical protein
VEGATSSNDEKRYVEKLKIIAPTQIDFDFANDLLVLPQEMCQIQVVGSLNSPIIEGWKPLNKYKI